MATKRKAAAANDQHVVTIDGTRDADGLIEMATAHFVIRDKQTGKIVKRCTPAEVEAHNHSSVAATKKKKTPPRRHGEWKDAYEAALESLLRSEGKDSDAREDLERALEGMLDGTGQCPMTERPPDHIPLSARVSADGTVVTPCLCSGCEAARKCKCPACSATRRFAKSAEADRDERSASTEREAAAELIYEAAKPFLNKKPRRNRLGFTTMPASRTAWTALARYLQWHLNDSTITEHRLRTICERRTGRR